MSKSVVEPVRLELPFPPRGLSPNSRLGWRAKAAVVARYREDCGWVAYSSRLDGPRRLPLSVPVEATVTFVVPDRRRRDLDNLLAMLKPAWDGLVDSGVLAGDDASQFKVADSKIQHQNRPLMRSEGYVVVELRGSGAGTT